MNRLSLKIMPGYDCNQCCDYCDVKNRILDKSFTAFNEAQFLIDLYKTNPKFYMEAEGGDILCYPEIYQFLLKQNVPLYIFTNGTMIDSNFISLLNNKTFIRISIDGPEEIHNLHRKMKNGDNGFQKTMEGIRLLKSANINFIAAATLTFDSLTYLKEIHDFFVKLNPQSVILTTQMFQNDVQRLKTKQIYELVSPEISKWDTSLFKLHSFHNSVPYKIDNNTNVEILMKPDYLELNITGFNTPTLLRVKYQDFDTIEEKLKKYGIS